MIEMGHEIRNQLLEYWKSQMKLTSNKSLPILDRMEGELGGGNNQTKPFNPIIIDVFLSDNGL
jgi:hypothetical protein